MYSRLSSLVGCLMISLCYASTLHAATIVVNVDTDGSATANQCELRDAITAANTNIAVKGCAAGSAGVGGDRIEFDFDFVDFDTYYTITLTAGLPVITQSLEIAGPGMDRFAIDGVQTFPIIQASFVGGFLTIRGLALFQGLNTRGGCISISNPLTILIEDVIIDSCMTSSEGGGGGGAYILAGLADSSVALRRVILRSNLSATVGGGLRLSASQATIEDSLFQQNSAVEVGRAGGGLAIGGSTTLVISRSTFQGNTVVGHGAAIYILSSAANVTIEHSTISGNAVVDTTAFNGGGAISSVGTLTLANTVVAGNTENNPNHNNSDFSSSMGMLESKGFNFIGSNEGVEGAFPVVPQTVGDRAGTAAEPLDAMLNYLADNGGPTQTMMPKKYSPLINSGTCSGETQDQRGYRNLQTGMRPVVASDPAAVEDGCDTGAIEYLARQPDPQFEDSFE